MKKFYFAVLVLVGLGSQASAQKVSGIIKGVLQDSVSATPLADATVSIVRLQDSALISFTITNSRGAFEIKNIEAGSYNLVSSFQGLQTKKIKFSISAETPAIDLGLVQLSRLYKTMDAVVVTDEAPVKVKGDTLAYNADAFKTKPNATVEDLLKKLPGVQVDRDGTVKAQGENVQKVYVDGKEFFGSDRKLATKNLNADMIDQVEVFDDMSEQAKFNKIDDGSRSKAINLKLKKDKKRGTFGKLYAGAGTEDRYDAGVNANFFKGATQTSLIAKSNNINNVSFTVSDMLGMFGGGALKIGGGDFSAGSGGGMGGVRLGGMGTNFAGGMSGLNLGSTGNGLTSASQVGINYRDTWSKHFDVNGSYFYNQTQTTNHRKSYKQSFFQDSTGLTDENVFSRNNNGNHRLNMNMIYSIDSFNSIVYTPSFSTQNSQSFSDDTLMSSVHKQAADYHANESRNITNSQGDGFNWTNNLIWRRKFRRVGRTLSVNVSNTWNKNDREKFTTIYSRFFNQGGVKWFEGITNNLNNTESETRNYAVGLSYTEPIARDKMLELNYTHSDNRSLSDRKTLDYDPATGGYNKLVDTLTNNFQNQNLYDRIGGNFRVVKKKYNYQLGFSVQQTTLESENLTRKTNISEKYFNLFPTASFNYQFQRSRSLRLNYRGRTSQPTISQLQDITDVSGYPYLYRGNPGLKQEFSNNIMLSYNFFDVVKFRNLFAFVTFSNTTNKIANSTEDLGGGVQLTTPVNINGVYAVNGTFNFGLPIKHLKGGNFNTNTRISYNRDANLINKVRNYTKNLNIGEDLRLNYNFREKLDLGVTASVNYNSVQYTVQTRNNSSYFTHTYSADATYTFRTGFILSSDFDYTFNTGRTNGFNRNYAMWNGSFAKQVFKNKR
ncbi:MAG TPA: TonB-dependent receptor [Flavisolibacter sp.]|nr:TonB-dependent receptor [Flavisolibacter sp.]